MKKGEEGTDGEGDAALEEKYKKTKRERDYDRGGRNAGGEQLLGRKKVGKMSKNARD